MLPSTRGLWPDMLLTSPRACAGETGFAEAFGAREQQEMSSFLDACMQTAPLQYVHRLLAEKARRLSLRALQCCTMQVLSASPG